VRSRRRDKAPEEVPVPAWVAPPNWPAAPEGWFPPEDWTPSDDWGPAPDGWQFWQTPELPATEGEVAVQPDQTAGGPGPAASHVLRADGTPYMGRKADKPYAKVGETLPDLLLEGEAVVALFRGNKISPIIELLVVTDRRFLGVTKEAGKAKASLVVAGSKIVGHEISGMGNSLKVIVRNGEPMAFGALVETKDKDEFGAALTHLRETAPEIAEVYGLTEQQQAALEEGFPEKHIAVVTKIEEFLATAELHCISGDVVAEEHSLMAANALADSVGLRFGPKARRWLEGRKRVLAELGRIRRDVELVGRIGRYTTIMSDRILVKDDIYILDADVAASVEVDGHVLQTTRPTMTRMALGSVLPGSALLVGLAMPQTKTTDTRRAYFRIVHPKWQIAERLDPDKAHEVRGLAAQINAISYSLARGTAAPAAPTPVEPVAATSLPPAAPSPSPSSHAVAGGNALERRLAQLERIARLESDGALTPEEASTLRRQALEGG